MTWVKNVWGNNSKYSVIIQCKKKKPSTQVFKNCKCTYNQSRIKMLTTVENAWNHSSQITTHPNFNFTGKRLHPTEFHLGAWQCRLSLVVHSSWFLCMVQCSLKSIRLSLLTLTLAQIMFEAIPDRNDTRGGRHLHYPLCMFLCILLNLRKQGLFVASVYKVNVPNYLHSGIMIIIV